MWAALVFTAAFSLLIGFGVGMTRKPPRLFWKVELIPPLYGEQPRTGTDRDGVVTIICWRGPEAMVVKRLDASEDDFGQELLNTWAAAEEKCRDLNQVTA